MTINLGFISPFGLSQGAPIPPLKMPTGVPNIEELFNKPVSNNPSVGDTFGKWLSTLSNDIEKPYKLSEEMTSGKKKFNTIELVTSILEAERKLSLSVRVITDVVKATKQIEAIQA